MPDPSDIIERAERLLAEATPGPWHWNSYSRIGAPVPFGHPLNMADDDEPSFAGVCWVDGGPQQDGHGDDLIVPEAKANARLIAAAPALIADLLEEVKRLRAERDGIKDKMRRVGEISAGFESEAANLRNFNEDLKGQVQRSLHWQIDADTLRAKGDAIADRLRATETLLAHYRAGKAVAPREKVFKELERTRTALAEWESSDG